MRMHAWLVLMHSEGIFFAVIFDVPAVSSKLNLVEENLKKMPINEFSLSEEGIKMLFCYHDYADCYR